MRAGHKKEVALLVRGAKDSCSRGKSCESALQYRFDFLASPLLQDERRQHAGATERAHLHPFVTAAEVSLVRDQQDVLPASSSPDGAGAQQEGVVLATVVDSSDEQRLAALGNVSTGYANHRWLLRSDPTISFFKGSRLVADSRQGGGRVSKNPLFLVPAARLLSCGLPSCPPRLWRSSVARALLR